MKIENLKINQRLASAILTGAMVFSLAGCSPIKNNTSDRETYSVESTLKNESVGNIVIDNKLIAPDSIKLMNKSTKEIIEKVDGVVVGGEIKNITNPIDIKLGKDIEAIILGNAMMKPSEFVLVNNDTKEEITHIDSLMIGNELVPFDNSIFNSDTLTDADFEKSTKELYSKYKDLGLKLDESKFKNMMLVINNDSLIRNNSQLADNVIGSDVNVFMNDYNETMAILNNYNRDLLCARNFDYNGSYIKASDLVLTQSSKNKCQEIDNSIATLFSTIGNNDEFNKQTLPLLSDMINDTYGLKENYEGARLISVDLGFDILRETDCLGITNFDTVNAEKIKSIRPRYEKGEFDNNTVLNDAYTACVNNIFIRENTKTLTK